MILINLLPHREAGDEEEPVGEVPAEQLGPLADPAEAHRAIESRGSVGKVSLTVG